MKRHYIKPGGDYAGGVFIPECGLNNGFGPQSRCDALYAGFTSTSGRILIGHELKVSRADWRHELDQPGKADVWADNCHQWYVVAPSTEVVPVEELPAGWGLMVPNPRTTTRLTIAHRAASKPQDHAPSWTVARSMLARLDTLHRQAVAEVKQKANEKVAQRVTEQLANQVIKGLDYSTRHKLDLIAKLEKLTGCRIEDWSMRDDELSPEQVARLVQLVRAGSKVDDHARGVRHELARGRAALAAWQEAAAAVDQALTDLPQGETPGGNSD